MSRRVKPEAFYQKTCLDWVDILPYETAVIGTATRFDTKKREVIVDLGYSWIGIIPEEEVSIYTEAYQEGKEASRPIASVIGKQIRAIVTGFLGERVLKLSRKMSMIEGWNNLENQTNIMACITDTIKYGIFLDVGNGLVSYNSKKDCTSVIITDTKLWFNEGDAIEVKLLHKGEEPGDMIGCSNKLVYPTIMEPNVVYIGDIIAVRAGSRVNDEGFMVQYTPRICGIMDTKADLSEGQMVKARVREITDRGLKLNHIC